MEINGSVVIEECPEECEEVVQSLIYAAPRFFEFPELQDLHSAFIDIYGPPLESFVNKEVITDSSSSLFINVEAKVYHKGDEASIDALHSTRVLHRMEFKGRKKVANDRYKLQSSSEDEVFSVSRRDSTDQDLMLKGSLDRESGVATPTLPASSLDGSTKSGRGSESGRGGRTSASCQPSDRLFCRIQVPAKELKQRFHVYNDNLANPKDRLSSSEGMRTFDICCVTTKVPFQRNLKDPEIGIVGAFAGNKAFSLDVVGERMKSETLKDIN
ncbi:unnamed protein product [Dovyalis caffra]|uniref:Uncharacterized protein n=1 Tax=Dovyalis caffra TaxID=77055 RepID=A0AAV1RMW6_9ROSI|nr:unnamed protein product [Dovyalis caffra]